MGKLVKRVQFAKRKPQPQQLGATFMVEHNKLTDGSTTHDVIARHYYGEQALIYTAVSFEEAVRVASALNETLRFEVGR